jgi:hypothetical protein
LIVNFVGGGHKEALKLPDKKVAVVKQRQDLFRNATVSS